MDKMGSTVVCPDGYLYSSRLFKFNHKLIPNFYYSLCDLVMIYFFLQYIFMFQTPWLPECILSLRDFGMFKAMYRGKTSVSLMNVDNLVNL